MNNIGVIMQQETITSLLDTLYNFDEYILLSIGIALFFGLRALWRKRKRSSFKNENMDSSDETKSDKRKFEIENLVREIHESGQADLAIEYLRESLQNNKETASPVGKISSFKNGSIEISSIAASEDASSSPSIDQSSDREKPVRTITYRMVPQNQVGDNWFKRERRQRDPWLMFLIFVKVISVGMLLFNL
jgi:hypothetical protein